MNQALPAPATASCRPYPASLAAKPANRQTNAEAALQNKWIVPVENRTVLAGHSLHCESCAIFARRGGPCPGVVARISPESSPVCHVAALAPTESPA